MSIADEIAKKYSENMLTARAEARRKLISNAADDKKRIESTRPRKKKDDESIVDEAHPDQVFVMEADGLGGMVGNLEQVHEQIMNAINRRPSAFPYQGIVANAVLDFKKTAEILESHDLHVEADAVLKLAGDLLAVLQRQGKIKKSAMSGGLGGADQSGFFGNDFPAVPPGDQSGTPSVEARKGVITAPAPPTGPAAPTGSATAAQTTPTPQPPTPVASGPDTRNVMENAKKAQAAINSVEPSAPAERRWISKLKGLSGRALGGMMRILPIAFVAASIKSGVEDLGKGDASQLLALAAGGLLAGAAIALTGGTVGAIAAAAMNGALIADILGHSIKLGIEFLNNDGFVENLQNLQKHISKKIEDPQSKDGAVLLQMLVDVGGALNTVSDLQREAVKDGKDVEVSRAVSYLFDVSEHIANARKLYNDGKLEDDELNSLLEKVEESLEKFSDIVLSKYEQHKTQIEQAENQLKTQPDLAKETLDRIHAAQSSGSEFRPSSDLATESAKSSQVVETAVTDADEIKKIQGLLGTTKTGTWDEKTISVLEEIRNEWLGFDVKLRDVVTIPALQAAGFRVLEKIIKLWNERYTQSLPSFS